MTTPQHSIAGPSRRTVLRGALLAGATLVTGSPVAFRIDLAQEGDEDLLPGAVGGPFRSRLPLADASGRSIHGVPVRYLNAIALIT
ncbi:twin-arginine translocation signal domain-containing protein [Streptomyces sp. NPDC060031]|uniref:twin-arginine translocation signal domain-containing protein n=1 Tax=Streptomyces sp. NPDC060031 TaxID=3347043 RepID=UPI0036746A83